MSLLRAGLPTGCDKVNFKYSEGSLAGRKPRRAGLAILKGVLEEEFEQSLFEAQKSGGSEENAERVASRVAWGKGCIWMPG